MVYLDNPKLVAKVRHQTPTSANNYGFRAASTAAKEFNCDLLAMGAYAHSRLRQQILGGVTRHILEHATLPVMMHR
jgi:nucleotide-binding universal stress UspA family protein